MSLYARLNRVRKVAAASRTLRGEIWESVVGWTTVALQGAHYDIEHGRTLSGFRKALLKVYEMSEGTPGWEPRILEPGCVGPEALDPKKVEAAARWWVKRDGMPAKPITVRDVAASQAYANLIAKRKRCDGTEPQAPPEPE
jgi:hypothetical protein